jgi:hypothetical protein
MEAGGDAPWGDADGVARGCAAGEAWRDGAGGAGGEGGAEVGDAGAREVVVALLAVLDAATRQRAAVADELGELLLRRAGFGFIFLNCLGVLDQIHLNTLIRTCRRA